MRYLNLLLSMIVLLEACSPAVVQPQTNIAWAPTIMATVTATSTQDFVPSPAAEVEHNFQVCTIENTQNCVITEQELFDGSYLKLLEETQSKPFNPDKVGQLVFRYDQSYNPGIGAIWPDTFFYSKGKTYGWDFSDPETLPWRRGVTFAEVDTVVNGITYRSIIKPIEFYDVNDPTHNKWVLTSDSMIALKSSEAVREAAIQNKIGRWQKMDVTPILNSENSPGRDYPDPIVKQTFDQFPDMAGRFSRFANGDLSALSQAGIVLLTIDDDYGIFHH